MSFIKPYLYGIAAMFMLGLIVGAYLKGRTDANAICAATVRAMQVEAQAQKDAEAERYRKQAAKLEKKNAEARIVYRDIYHEVEKIVDRPIYRDGVCIDDDGLRLVNAAFAGQAATPAESTPAMSDVESIE